MNPLRSRIVIGGYKAVSWLALHTPRHVARKVSIAVGWIGPHVQPSVGLRVGNHIERVQGSPASRQQVRDAYASYVRYWFDAFRSPRLSAEQLQTEVTGKGWDNVEAALEAGNGIVIALPHLGNWDIAGAWFVSRGVPLTVVVEELDPPELFEWFRKFRSSIGLKVVVNGPKVGSELIAALRNNEAIALLCDRDVDGTGGEFEFFGEVTKVPKGPATLALRTGAALLPTAVYEQGDGFVADLGKPVDVQRVGKLGEDVNRVTIDLIGRLEDLIRQAPEQWHVFVPNWPSDSIEVDGV